MSPTAPARMFLGSSSEGRDIARNLEAELAGVCEVERWDRNVFEPGGNALDSLLSVARRVDFAVLIATPDDTTESRGATTPSARDNVLLEFGLFAGVLGRERVYLMAAGDIKIPSDVFGVTRLPYLQQSDGNHRAAVNSAALQIEERVCTLGHLWQQSTPERTDSASVALDRELALLCSNAVAQGWAIGANSETALRLRSPKGKTYALPKTQPDLTRADLRRFVAELRAAGLRVSLAIRRPVSESPF